MGVFLTKEYYKAFKYLVDDQGFKKKGKVYCRLVNNEIIQSISLFKLKIMPSFTLNIGIFPLCIELNERLLYEGVYRLGEFINYTDTWWDYNPLNLKDIKLAMEDTYKGIQHNVMPVFNRVIDYNSYNNFIYEFEKKVYGEAIENSGYQLWVNLKLGDFQRVVQMINIFEKEKYEADKVNIKIFTKDDYEKYIEVTDRYFNKYKVIRNAIEKNDENYIKSILKKNEERSINILKKFQ